MSGGVDSSLTAKLLADQVNARNFPSKHIETNVIHQDFDLSAVFMRNWDTRDESGTDKGCEWEKDWGDVQRVCRHLDVPCEMVCCSPLSHVIIDNRFSSKDRPIKRILEQSFPACSTPMGTGRVTESRCVVQ